MITCGHYHAEDKTCGLDGDVCMQAECSRGLYETEQPDQGDMFEGSKCRIVCGGFQCTMPEWV